MNGDFSWKGYNASFASNFLEDNEWKRIGCWDELKQML